jgi:hypothetical protein
MLVIFRLKPLFFLLLFRLLKSTAMNYILKLIAFLLKYLAN